MPKQANLGALSVVLILSLGLPEVTDACPHPCACYVPTEVHCTFRSLVAVPTRISKHVERINLGFNSIQAVSENSFAGLRKLELLMIHGNDIQNVPNGALKDLISLQVFKISYNKLQVITGQTLQGLSSLMRLHMDHNRIEFIHPNAFNGLTSLRLLHLEGNLLQQLHPNTFSTFMVLDYFRLSTIRHLYLSENAIQTLPRGIFQKMPLLENTYLHGNPWSCDCRLQWLLEWNEKTSGILKCKKDKAYEDGQLCPKCTYPKQLQKQDIQHLKDISCTKPIIQSPLKWNNSHNALEEEDDESSDLSVQEFQLSPWNITLNMTDEHGNIVNLNCEIKKPSDSTTIQWNSVSPQQIEFNATIFLDLECLMNRDNYEKLWKLIAYYSEVPVKLERAHVLSQEPKLSYYYRQGSDYDALYYTGVKGTILADPIWVMQPLIHIQLNRRQSTGKKVVLTFSTQISQTLQTQENRQQRSSWVMIEQDRHIKAAQSVVEGTDAQLSCNVKASESPAINWVLPDGTKLKAPFKVEGSRFSVLSSGQLIIRSAAYSDAGVYHCIAQVRSDVDRMTYRVLVQPPVIQPDDSEVVKVEKYVGDSILLPCSAAAVPDAYLSWILPSSRVLSDLSNSSNGYMLYNGTLFIPHSHVSDGGYYRCVAVNQQGSDQFAVKVVVNKMVSDRASKRGKFKKRPGSRTSVKGKGQVIEDGDGSGDEETDETLTKRFHLKGHEIPLKQRNDNVPHAQAKKNKKGKRKMKLWKGMDRTEEINVAEGRRPFESRRRINMANKQINPQHWAHILAKVRGKNLPKATPAPIPSSRTTIEIPLIHKTTKAPPLPPPIASPPLQAALKNPVRGEESSGDISHLSEAELFSVTIPPIISVQDYNSDRIPSTVVSIETELSIERESSNTPESIYTMELPIAGDTRLSPTLQSQAWEHSDSRADFSPAVINRTGTFTKEFSNEEAMSIPSTLDIAGNGERAAPYILPHAERPLEAIAPAELERPETGLQQNNRDILDNDAKYSTHSLIKSSMNSIATTTGFAPVSSWKSASIKHRHVSISSDPNRGSENVTLGGKHVQKSEASSIVESITAPFNKKVWLITPTVINKLTTTAVTMVQHPRRRPFGKRRFRPNRFRRPKPLPSATFTTEKTPFIQKIHGTELATQRFQASIFKDYHKSDTETPVRMEYKSLEVNSSLTTSVNVLQRSTRVQEAASILQLPTLLPNPPVTLSNLVEDPKDSLVTSTHYVLTTEPEMSLHLSHSSGNTLAASKSSEVLIKAFEGNYFVTNYKTTNADATSSSWLIENVTRPVSTPAHRDSVIPEFEELVYFGSSAPEDGVRGSVPLSKPATDWYLTTVDSTVEHFSDLPTLEELQKVSESINITVAPLSHQKEIMTASSTIDDHLYETTESEQAINPGHTKANLQTALRHTKEKITELQDHPDRTEKYYSPVLPIASVHWTTTFSPSISSSLNLFDHSSTKTVHTSGQVASMDNNRYTVEDVRTNLSSRQNELFRSNPNRLTTQQKHEQLKNPHSGRTYNSLPLNPNVPQKPVGIIPSFNQPPAFVPPKHIPVRGTMKPPYIIAPGLFHRFVTHRPLLHFTNKPEITAYAAHTTQDRKPSSRHIEILPTTTGAPLHKPKSHTPSRFGGHVFTNNYLPDTKDKSGRVINQAIPYLPKPRIPFLLNRTRIFQNLGINAKSPLPSLLLPVSTTEKKLLTPAKIITQSTPLRDTLFLVPPISLRTVPPAATSLPNIAPSIKPQMTSTTQSSGSIHYSHPSVSFVPKLGVQALNSSIIQLSTNVRSQGGRPTIISKGSPSLSVLAESDAVVPCDALGEPKPFLSWTKISTGALMTANTRIQRFEVLKNGTFIIHNVQLQDRGQYLCTAQNVHGVDKMIVLLTVVVQQPKILGSRFRDVTVYFGEKVTMDCQANGIPSPHISWIFPDRQVLQTVSSTGGRVTLYENRTLCLEETNFSDRGVYKCIASNAAGADSIAVRLHIAALPPIIQQDKRENISLSVGQSINLHCTAKAAPLPSIRWVLFDGTQIRTSQFIRGNLFVFPNGTLYIRSVSPKDSGSYECIAANMVGAARRTVSLHIKNQSTNAKITGSSPQQTDVTYGGRLQLDCSASGDPWPRILWRLPSKRMVDSLQSLDNRIKVFGNGTLVVHPVTDKDAGDYLCVARNKIGDDYVVLKVNVMMKPAKIEHTSENNHKVMYGGDLKVDCVATGLPNPEISWGLPDGSMINTFMQSDDSGSRTKRYVVFNNGTLYLNEVGLREAGDYICYAENQIGKDEMTVRVKVLAEPATIRNKTFSSINVPYGNVVSVGCEAKGDPTPKLTWLSPSNRPIPLLSDKYQVYTDGTLLIQKAQRSDSGNYTCVARNNAGEDRKIVWIRINVQPPQINGHPNTITSVREMAMRDSRKLIACEAEGIPSPRVMWAFPEGVILPAPYYGNRITVHRNGTLDIRGVRQTDSVQLVCIGRNEGGEARLIVQLQVMDHVEKPTFRDPITERIVATAGHSINLNCSVHGNPQPSTAWLLPNGTELQKGNHLHRFYHRRDGILHISALSAVDAGTYRCTARNPGGRAERVVFLQVGLKPEISNQYKSLVSIINGETLQLHCITQPSQRAHVTWTLPSGIVLDGPQVVGRFSLLENGSLTVREASVFDRGTYLCKVATEYGSSLMNVPVIVIAYPPRITSEPAPVIYLRPGNTVKLNCVAIGIPKAEIAWELPDKSHLTTGAQSRLYGNKLLHPQGSLIIQQATQRDAGFYKCTAKNILGSDSKATYIQVF